MVKAEKTGKNRKNPAETLYCSVRNAISETPTCYRERGASTSIEQWCGTLSFMFVGVCGFIVLYM